MKEIFKIIGEALLVLFTLPIIFLLFIKWAVFIAGIILR